MSREILGLSFGFVSLSEGKAIETAYYRFFIPAQDLGLRRCRGRVCPTSERRVGSRPGGECGDSFGARSVCLPGRNWTEAYMIHQKYQRALMSSALTLIRTTDSHWH